LGHLEASLNHMNAAIGMHTAHANSVFALFAGPDHGVFCSSYLGHLNWHRGLPDRSTEHSEEAIRTAEQIRDPFSQAIALDYAAMLHVFRGESRFALERSRQAADLCRVHGFAYYLAMAEALLGWARAAEGEVTAGLAQLRESFQSLRAVGAEVRLPYYYALM